MMELQVLQEALKVEIQVHQVGCGLSRSTGSLTAMLLMQQWFGDVSFRGCFPGR